MSGAGSAGLEELLTTSPVIPVVVVPDAADAVPLARALLAGGVGVIEVTLRSPAALEAIRRIAAEVPQLRLGAGTLLSPQDVDAAARAGAQFLVTPGSTPGLLAALDEADLPYLAGAATVSEMLTLAEHGVRAMKFFPAQAAGGAAYLKAVAGPLPALRFCPTGGIDLGNAGQYLALPSVSCVGGSWLTPRDVLARRDWTKVTELAARSVRELAPGASAR